MAEKTQQEETLHFDLYTIIKDLLYNLWVIVMAALSFMILTYTYFGILRAPRYTTSATFAVTVKTNTAINAMSPTEYQNLSTANRMASALAPVFSSDEFRLKILEGTEFEDPEILEDIQISAEILSNTNLITVKTEAGSARRSFLSMQALQQNYGKISDYVFSNATLEVLDTPVMPEESSDRENIIKYTIYAGIIGVLLCGAIIVVLSVLRDTVKNVQDLERKIDTTRLGTVYYEQKNRTLRSKMKKVNKSLLITNPVTSFTFTESYHKIRMRMEYIMESKKLKTVLVTSVGENEGKSTVAANIALSLAQKGYKVLLVDADLWKPAQYKIFDMKKARVKGYGRVLQEKGNLSDALQYDKEHNLYELFECKSIANSGELLMSETMQRILAKAETLMDYIVIDSAPMMITSDTEALSGIVDASLLVIRQDRILAEQINDCIDTLRESHSEYIGCVFNNVHTYAGARG